MLCLPKNIPGDLALASGNRGVKFFKSGCDLPDQEKCFIVLEENSDFVILKEESDELITEPIYVFCNS